LVNVNKILEEEFSQKEIIKRKKAYQNADEETKRQLGKLETLKDYRRKSMQEIFKKINNFDATVV